MTRRTIALLMTLALGLLAVPLAAEAPPMAPISRVEGAQMEGFCP